MTKEPYKYFPQTKEELRSLIEQRIKIEGNEVNLNDIDVSQITDMSELFCGLKFNGDISEWDVSNVTDMRYMFYYCRKFNQDISKWKVSKVTDMNHMFYRCESFNKDISKWDVSKVYNMLFMFYNCASFNQDLSKWDVSKVRQHSYIFENCPIKDEYKSKFKKITMTKEQAKQMAEVFNAYAEGKPIEVFLDGEWCEITSNGFNFDVEKELYRIKKEPKYRPFKNAVECLYEMQKHQPFGWLRWDKVFIPITKIRPENIDIDGGFYRFNEVLYKKITFADGQPFGIKE